jgi:hypothetical protein
MAGISNGVNILFLSTILKEVKLMGENGHRGLAVKARTIYSQRLKQTLEACCRGQFVAIEVDSGDYFLGSTPLEAIKNGKAKYPEKAFHVMKVGYKAAVLLKRRPPGHASSCRL